MTQSTYFVCLDGFENSAVPCIAQYAANGGDPEVVCTFGEIYDADALVALVGLANSVAGPSFIGGLSF